MNRSRFIIVEVLIAMLALGGGFGSFVRADNDAEQKSVNTDGKAKGSKDSPIDLADANSTPSEMRGVIERYTADRGSLARFYSVEGSSARQARMREFYAGWLGTLAKINFDSMSQDGRIDYLLFKNHLDHELRQLDLQTKAQADVAVLVPFGQTITDLEDARRRMEAIDSPRIAALFTKMAKQIDGTSKAVESGLKPRREPRCDQNKEDSREPSRRFDRESSEHAPKLVRLL